jgi:hypothetical protein
MTLRRSEPTRINNLIYKDLGKKPLFAVMQNWHAIVGDIIFKVAVPVRFKNSILIVGVTTHSWIQELILSKHIVMKRIQKFTQEVQDIKFAIKTDLVGLQRDDYQSIKQHKNINRKVLSKELMQYVESVATAVEDDELRDIVYNTMYDALTI